uniref:Si:dkey-118k5.3 n=1 Tax=Cyprinus carpio TaxID=7962 RepID=A0A8C1QV52_CYPCA
MADESCSTEIQQRRVELVGNYSKHLTHLLDLLFNVGAVTEEDLSLVRGSAVRGERECMRVLLDVLNGRGEEACRAFLYVLPSVQDKTAKLGQANRQEHLKKHKDILARQHGLVDYLSIRRHCLGHDETGCWTDITFSRQAGYASPSQCRHESAGVGDEICIFKDVYENLLCSPASGVNMLSGDAGSGKTTFVRRLVREWAAETNSSKTVLSLSFRELNLITQEQSLQDLLSDHYIHLKPFLPELLNSNPAQFLLILDGLDEFCYPLNFEHTPKCSDPERVQPIQSIVVNLIKGNLLPGVSIFLTSRPHAVTKVPPVLVSQFYSLLGFSVAQQKQYFEQNCSSPEAAEAVLASVSSHKPLLLMCHIPAFCWIVSTALHDGGSCLFPDTAGANSGEKGGLLERRFIFESSDLNSFNLDSANLSQVFLSEILKEDRASLTFEKGFHFIHTSMQEFLAALYYVLQSLSGSDPFSGLKPSTGCSIQNALKQMASAVNKFNTPQRLFRRRIKKALRCGERHQSGHMDLFARYLL